MRWRAKSYRLLSPRAVTAIDMCMLYRVHATVLGMCMLYRVHATVLDMCMLYRVHAAVLIRHDLGELVEVQWRHTGNAHA